MNRHTMRDRLAGVLAAVVLLASGCYGLNQHPDPIADHYFSVPDPTPPVVSGEAASGPTELDGSELQSQ